MEKINQELLGTQETRFSLAKMINWYQENESWWRALKTEASFYKRLNDYKNLNRNALRANN